jgi:hypothetical protein
MTKLLKLLAAVALSIAMMTPAAAASGRSSGGYYTYAAFLEDVTGCHNFEVAFEVFSHPAAADHMKKYPDECTSFNDGERLVTVGVKALDTPKLASQGNVALCVIRDLPPMTPGPVTGSSFKVGHVMTNFMLLHDYPPY